jgi:hypothetical protein
LTLGFLSPLWPIHVATLDRRTLSARLFPLLPDPGIDLPPHQPRLLLSRLVRTGVGLPSLRFTGATSLHRTAVHLRGIDHLGTVTYRAWRLGQW